MADYFGMGGYGLYVWSAYAVFAIVLLADALTPQLKRRHILRQLAARVQRQARKRA